MTQPAKSWSSAAVFFIPGGLILSLYLWTGAPGAWWGDGLELAAAAKTLGVPHPTGYPLYMVLGHLTIRAAPFLDAGRALTIFSSLLCAGSAAMLGALLFVRLKERDSARESDADRRPLSIALAASGAALALAFTRTLWEHATFAEVYPLTLGLGVGIVALAGGEKIRGLKGVAVLGSLWGLAMLNHYSIIALGPLVAFAVLRSAKASARPARHFLVFFGVAGAFLLGYLYLPLRASANPPLNWGDPSSPGRILWVLTGGDYGAMNFSRDGSPGAAVIGGLARWIDWWGRQVLPESWADASTWLNFLVGFVLAAGALAGCIAAARRNPSLGWGLAASIAATAMFSILYRIPDIEGYFLIALPAALLGWAELLCLGVEALHRRRSPPPAARVAMAGLPLVLAAYLLLAHYGHVEKSWDDGPERWASRVLESLPEDAIILTRQGADSEIYALWYAQIVQGLRPDVTVFGTGFIFQGWYRKYFEAEGRPRLPLFITERVPGPKSDYDWALAAGVILPNAASRRIFTLAPPLDSSLIDPMYQTYMKTERVSQLLDASYYGRTAYPYKSNLPGRWLIELHPKDEFAPFLREKFEETFGHPPPAAQ